MNNRKNRLYSTNAAASSGFSRSAKNAFSLRAGAAPGVSSLVRGGISLVVLVLAFAVMFCGIVFSDAMLDDGGQVFVNELTSTVEDAILGENSEIGYGGSIDSDENGNLIQVADAWDISGNVAEIDGFSLGTWTPTNSSWAVYSDNGDTNTPSLSATSVSFSVNSVADKSAYFAIYYKLTGNILKYYQSGKSSFTLSADFDNNCAKSSNAKLGMRLEFTTTNPGTNYNCPYKSDQAWNDNFNSGGGGSNSYAAYGSTTDSNVHTVNITPGSNSNSNVYMLITFGFYYKWAAFSGTGACAFKSVYVSLGTNGTPSSPSVSYAMTDGAWNAVSWASASRAIKVSCSDPYNMLTSLQYTQDNASGTTGAATSALSYASTTNSSLPSGTQTFSTTVTASSITSHIHFTATNIFGKTSTIHIKFRTDLKIDDTSPGITAATIKKASNSTNYTPDDWSTTDVTVSMTNGTTNISGLTWYYIDSSNNATAFGSVAAIASTSATNTTNVAMTTTFSTGQYSAYKFYVVSGAGKISAIGSGLSGTSYATANNKTSVANAQGYNILVDTVSPSYTKFMLTSGYYANDGTDVSWSPNATTKWNTEEIYMSVKHSGTLNVSGTYCVLFKLSDSSLAYSGVFSSAGATLNLCKFLDGTDGNYELHVFSGAKYDEAGGNLESITASVIDGMAASETLTVRVDTKVPNTPTSNSSATNDLADYSRKWYTAASWSAPVAYTLKAGDFDTTYGTSTNEAANGATKLYTKIYDLTGLSNSDILNGTASTLSSSYYYEYSTYYDVYSTTLGSCLNISLGSGGTQSGHTGAYRVDIWVVDQAGNTSGTSSYLVYWDTNDYDVTFSSQGNNSNKGTTSIVSVNGSNLATPITAASVTYKRGQSLGIKVDTTSPTSYCLNQILLTQYGDSNYYSIYDGALHVDANYWTGSNGSTSYLTASKIYFANSTTVWSEETYSMAVGPLGINDSTTAYAASSDAFASFVTSYRAMYELTRVDTQTRYFNARSQGIYLTIDSKVDTAAELNWTTALNSVTYVSYTGYSAPTKVYGNSTSSIYMTPVVSGLKEAGSYIYYAQAYSPDLISNPLNGSFIILSRTLTITPLSAAAGNSKTYGDEKTWLWNNSTSSFTVGVANAYADPEILYSYEISAYTFNLDGRITYNGTSVVQGSDALGSSYVTKYLTDDNGNELKQVENTGLSRANAGENYNNGHFAGSYQINGGNLVWGYNGSSSSLTTSFTVPTYVSYYVINKREIEINVNLSAHSMETMYDATKADDASFVIATTGVGGETGENSGDIYSLGTVKLAYADTLKFSFVAVFSQTTGSSQWGAGLYAVAIEFTADASNSNYTVSNQYVDSNSGFNSLTAVLQDTYFFIRPDTLYVRPTENQGKQFGEISGYTPSFNIYTDPELTAVDNNHNIYANARYVRQSGEDAGTYYYTNAYGFFYGSTGLFAVSKTGVLASNYLETYCVSNGDLIPYSSGISASTVYSNYREYSVGTYEADGATKKYFGQYLLEAAIYMKNLTSGFNFSTYNAFVYIYDAINGIVPFNGDGVVTSDDTDHDNIVADTGVVFLYCPNYYVLAGNLTGVEDCLYTGSNAATLQTNGYTYTIAPRDSTASTTGNKTIIAPFTNISKTYGDTETSGIGWGIANNSGGAGDKSLLISAFTRSSNPCTFGLGFADGSLLTRAIMLPSSYTSTYTVTITSQVDGSTKNLSFTAGDWMTYENAQSFKTVNGNSTFAVLFEQVGTYYIVPSVDYGESINWDGYLYGYYETALPAYTYLNYVGDSSHISFKYNLFNTIWNSDTNQPIVANLHTYVINKKALNMSVFAGQTFVYGDTNFAGGNKIVAHTIAGFVNNSAVGIADITYTSIGINNALAEAWHAYVTSTDEDFLDNDTLKTAFANGFVGLYVIEDSEYVAWSGDFTDLGDGGTLYRATLASGLLSGVLAPNSLQAGTTYVSTASYSSTALKNYALSYDTVTSVTIKPRNIYLYFFDNSYADTSTYTDSALLTTYFAQANKISKVYDGLTRITSYRMVFDYSNTIGNADSGAVNSEILTPVCDSYLDIGYSRVVTNYQFLTGSYTFNGTFRVGTITTGNYVYVLASTIYATIGQKSVTVDQTAGGSSSWLNIANKTYDGSTDAYALVSQVNGFGSTGIISGDSVTFSLYSAKFADANVYALGSVELAKNVALVFTMSGADAGNYSSLTVTVTAKITRAAIDVSVGDVSVEFGNEATFGSAFTGWIGQDTATTVIGGAATYSTSPVDTLVTDLDYVANYGDLLSSSVTTAQLETFVGGSTHVITFSIGGVSYIGNYSFTITTGTLTVTKKTVTMSISDSSIPIATFAAYTQESDLVSALGVSIVPFPDGLRTFSSVSPTYAVSYFEQDGVTATTFAALLALAQGGDGGMFNIVFTVSNTDDHFTGAATLFFSIGTYQEIDISIAVSSVVYTGAELDFSKLLSFSFTDSNSVAQSLDTYGWSWVFGGAYSGTSSDSFLNSSPRNAGSYAVTMNVSYKPSSPVSIGGILYDGFYGNLPSGVITIAKAEAVIVAGEASKTYGSDDPSFTYSDYALYPVELSTLSATALSDVYARSVSDGYFYELQHNGTNFVVLTGDNTTVVYDASDYRLYRMVADVKDGISAASVAAVTGNLSRASGEDVGSYAILRGTVSYSEVSYAYKNHNVNLASNVFRTNYAGSRNSFEVGGTSIDNPSDAAELSITAKTVTVTIVTGSKVFDNTSAADIYYTVSGYVSELGDDDGLFSATFAIKSKIDVADEDYDAAVAAGHTVLGSAGAYYYYIDSVHAGAYDVVWSDLVCNAAGKANYVAEVNGWSGVFTIRRRPVSVTVLTYSATKEYGEADPDFQYTYNASEIVDSSSFSGAISRQGAGTLAGETAGIYYAFTQGTLALSSDYSVVVNASTRFYIRKATLTVTQANVTREYYETNPDGTTLIPVITGYKSYSYYVDGVLHTQNDSSTVAAELGSYILKYTYKYGGTLLTYDSDAGTYLNAITAQYVNASGTPYSNNNYNIVYVSSNLVITPIDVYLIASSSRYTKVYGTTDIASLFNLSNNGNPKLVSDLVSSGQFTVTIDSSRATELIDRIFVFGCLSRDVNENVGSYQVSIGSVVITRSSSSTLASPNFNLSINSFAYTITQRSIVIRIDNRASASTLSKQYGDVASTILATGDKRSEENAATSGWATAGWYYSAAYPDGVGCYISDSDANCIVANTGSFAYYFDGLYNYRYLVPGTYAIAVQSNYVVSGNYSATTSAVLYQKVNSSETATYTITPKAIEVTSAVFSVNNKIYDGTNTILDGDSSIDYSLFNLVNNGIMRDSITISYAGVYSSANAGTVFAYFDHIALDEDANDQSSYYTLQYYDVTALAYYPVTTNTRFSLTINSLGDNICILQRPIDFVKSSISLVSRQYDGTTNAQFASYVSDGVTYYNIGVPEFIQKAVADYIVMGLSEYSIEASVSYKSKNVGNNVEAVVSVLVNIPNASNNFIAGSIELASGESYQILSDSISIQLNSGVFGAITYRSLYLSVLSAQDKVYDNTSHVTFAYRLDNIVKLSKSDGSFYYETVGVNFSAHFVNVDEFGNVTTTAEVGTHPVVLEEQNALGDYFVLTGIDRGNYRLILSENGYSMATEAEINAEEDVYTWDYSAQFSAATKEQINSFDNIYLHVAESYIKLTYMSEMFETDVIASNEQIEAGENLYVVIGMDYVVYDPELHTDNTVRYCVPFEELYHLEVVYDWTAYDESLDYTAPTSAQLTETDKLFVKIDGEYVQYISGFGLDDATKYYHYTDIVYSSPSAADVNFGQNLVVLIGGDYVDYDAAVHGEIVYSVNSYIVSVGGSNYDVYLKYVPTVYYKQATAAQLAAGESLFVLHTGYYRLATSAERALGYYLYVYEGGEYVLYDPLAHTSTVYYYMREYYEAYDETNLAHQALFASGDLYFRYCRVFKQTQFSVDYPACAVLRATISVATLEVTANIANKTYDGTTNASVVKNSEIVTAFSNISGQGYSSFRLDTDVAVATFSNKNVAYVLNNVTTREVRLSNILLYYFLPVTDLLATGETYQDLLTDGYVNYAYLPAYYRAATTAEQLDSSLPLYVRMSEYYVQADINTIAEYLNNGLDLYLFDGSEFVLRDVSTPIRADVPTYYKRTDVCVRYDPNNVDEQFPSDAEVLYCYFDLYVPYSVSEDVYSVLLPDGFTTDYTSEEFAALAGDELYKLYYYSDEEYTAMTSYSYVADGLKTLVLKTSGGLVSNYTYNTTADLYAYILRKTVTLNSANAHIEDKIYDQLYAGNMIFKAELAEAAEYYTALKTYLGSLAETAGDISTKAKFDYAVAAAVAENFASFIVPGGELFTVINGDAFNLFALLESFDEEQYNNFMAVTEADALNGLSTAFGNTVFTTTDTLLVGIVDGDVVIASYSVNFRSREAGNNINVTIKVNGLTGAQSGNYYTGDALNITVKGNILPKELSITLASVKDKVYDGTGATEVEDIRLSGILNTAIRNDIVSVSTIYTAMLETTGDASTITEATQFAETGYYGVLYNLVLTGAQSGNYTFKLVDNFVWKDAFGNFNAFAVLSNGIKDNTNGISARTLSVTRWADGKAYDGTTAISKGSYGYVLGNVTGNETINSDTPKAYSIDLAYEYYEVISGSGIYLPKVFYVTANASTTTQVAVEMNFVNKVYNMVEVGHSATFDASLTYYVLVRNTARNSYQYTAQTLTEAQFNSTVNSTTYYVRGSENKNYVLRATDIVNRSAQATISPLTVTATANNVSSAYGSYDRSKLSVTYNITSPVTYYTVGNYTYTMAYATANGFGAQMLASYGDSIRTENFDTEAQRAELLNFSEVEVRCEDGFSSYSDVGSYDIYIVVLRDANTTSVDTLPNYVISAIPGVYEVTKETLRLSVADYQRAFGSANPDFVINYSGWVSGDPTSTSNGYFTAPTVTCAANTLSDIGTNYDIMLSNGYSKNYRMVWLDSGNIVHEITSTPLSVAKLTITKAVFSSAIVFNGYTKDYNGKGVSIDITSGNTIPAGTTVQYADSENGATNFYDSPKSFINAGTYTITARLTNPNYETKSYPAVIQINKVAPRISAATVSAIYTGSSISGVAADLYPYYLPVNFYYGTENNVDNSPMESAPVNAGTYYFYAYTPGNNNYLAAKTATSTITIIPFSVGVNIVVVSYIEGTEGAEGVTFTLANESLTSTIMPVVQYTNRTTAEKYAVGAVPSAAGSYDFVITSTNGNYSLYGNKGILTIGASSMSSANGEMTISPVGDGTIIESNSSAVYNSITKGDVNVELDPEDEDYDEQRAALAANKVLWASANSAMEGNYKVLAVVVADLVDKSGSSVATNGTVTLKILLPEGIDVDKAVFMRYNADGTAEIIENVTVESGYAIITTDSVGTFVIAQKITPLWVWIAIGGGGAIFIIAVLAYTLISNKNRQLRLAQELVRKNSVMFEDDGNE